MAQVPGCGCDTGGTGGGGGTCASVVIQRVCADDGSDAPLLSRTVVLCNGTLLTDVVYPNGDPYVGNIKECPCCQSGGGGGDGCRCDYRVTPLDHQTLSVGGAPTSLPAAPAGTDMVLIENIPRGSRPIRWTDDGVSPVGGGAAGRGHFMLPGLSIEYRGNFAAWEAVVDSGAAATLALTFYSIA